MLVEFEANFDDKTPKLEPPNPIKTNQSQEFDIDPAEVAPMDKIVPAERAWPVGCSCTCDARRLLKELFCHAL